MNTSVEYYIMILMISPLLYVMLLCNLLTTKALRNLKLLNVNEGMKAGRREGRKKGTSMKKGSYQQIYRVLTKMETKLVLDNT